MTPEEFEKRAADNSLPGGVNAISVDPHILIALGGMLISVITLWVRKTQKEKYGPRVCYCTKCGYVSGVAGPRHEKNVSVSRVARVRSSKRLASNKTVARPRKKPQ